MPQRSTTVRFDDDLLGPAGPGGRRGGVSAAQFVRDAAVIRLGYLAAQRGDERATTTVAALASRARARSQAVTHPAVLDEHRIAALEATGLLDSPPDPAFDRLTRVATEALGAPVALVSLVDADRQFFTSSHGLAEPWASRRETPLSHSYCQHVVIAREPLVVRDAREHTDLRDSPAIDELGAIAYLGVPLITGAGTALGSLCATDSRPRDWTASDVATMTALAAVVVRMVEEQAARAT